ncbi:MULTISPECIES: DUF3127 domain-containing protein [Sphingobacterium]|jgi:hypothetical protein|uniref:DUF3127 domain-containing protein n=2 Tax=Sphingobacterium TaxID=28453 RepID=A0ABW5Z1Y7_9SPHI|nr:MULTISPECIES: DUF3127 domain-containing protein [Sphingobacterium]CDS94151.1 conserved hypothetical protein [Sphingobacterium sp. PM2-P1-29]SJN51285.1 hypothetical protein FM120_29870 [Sphingobacterium faecium PCAi_F2.5]HCU44468.1 DUF3127 domain-containing protein [Sphingobacterium sp.]KKX48534.1 hypothetical protein L950_0220520 [Sphingobacterium sp. IITKGP-BTPF85]MBB2953931.1 hypothetical protein [Sphingobacterium sp. JUb56]
MEIRGKVHEIGATQQVTESFKKRDIIVAYAENPQFVEYIRFEATQDRTSIFDGLTVGEEIEVSFNLRGRPWTNKEGVTTYFNSLVAWRVTKLANTAASAPAPGYAEMPAPVDLSGSNDDDDLPF